METQADIIPTNNNKKLLIISVVTLFIVLITAALSIFYYNQYQSLKTLEVLVESKNADIEKLNKEKADIEQEKALIKKELDALKNPPYFTNYFPVKFLIDDFQKVGQTFTIQESKFVTSIVLQGSYGVGSKSKLSIYQTESPTDMGSSPLIGSGEFLPSDIVQGKKFSVLLDKPVELKPNITYFLVVEIPDKKTEVNIGFTEQDTNKNGVLYKYTRSFGGNGDLLDPLHSWQPANSQDLIFELQ